MTGRARRLAGKVALVTGAASGIGLRTAERFAEEGATVILADRNAEALSAALARVLAVGGSHRSVALDVTREDDWIRVMAEIGASFGRLDILVNNAGVGEFRALLDTSLAQWRATMAVNLDGVFLGTKHAIPLLAKAGGAAIVNMSSIRGMVAGVGTSAYAASKAGVRLLTKSTALECAALGNGVRANSVHPAQIETAMSDAAMVDPAVRRAMIDKIPLGRIGQPDDVANAVVYLAGDESSFMTGSELVIDGGFTAQ